MRVKVDEYPAHRAGMLEPTIRWMGIASLAACPTSNTGTDRLDGPLSLRLEAEPLIERMFRSSTVVGDRA